MDKELESLSHIPLSVPHIQGNEWLYVKECLDTNWVSSVGSFVDKFEEILSEYIGANYSIATINGTSALHVALMVAGVQPDDEVVMPTLTFVAPANAVRYCGAWPVFMDVDPDYWQMDPDKTVEFLDNHCKWQNGRLINNQTGRTVSALLPVHLLGHPCEMDSLIAIARKYDLAIIEDASESLGARYKGQMVGQLGDLGCFSFNGNKTITTGGGGMIVTNDQSWAERSRYLTTQAKDDQIEYIHNSIGYNYRLSNLQAAVGVAQMENINDFLEVKRHNAVKYTNLLADIPNISSMSTHPQVTSTHWLYTMLLSQGTTLEKRKEIIATMNGNGIGCRPLWHPIHSLPPYQNCQAFKIDHAVDIYVRGVSLPSSVGLQQDELERTVDMLKRAIQF